MTSQTTLGLAATLAASALLAPTASAQDTVAHFRLQESGNTFYSSCGSSTTHGTKNEVAATFPTAFGCHGDFIGLRDYSGPACIDGERLRFNGANSVTVTGYPRLANLHKDAALSFWVDTQTSVTGPVALVGNADSWTVVLDQSTTGTVLRFKTNAAPNAPGIELPISFPSSLPCNGAGQLSNYRHVTISIRDQISTASAVLDYYLDGQLQGTYDGSGAASTPVFLSPTTSAGSWRLGSPAIGGTPFGSFTGHLSDVRLFDRALVAQQVSELYLNPGAPLSMVQVGVPTSCQVNPNSSGAPAQLIGFGSPLLADNDFTLEMTSLPPGEFGYFLIGNQEGFIPLGNSEGILCLGASSANGQYIGRYNQVASDIWLSSPAGTASLPLDLTRVVPFHASSGLNTPVQAGVTYYLQGWTRDRTSTGASTSNFTNALGFMFQ